MYDAKKFLDIANAIIKGYSEKYDRFLDERRTEWVRQVERNFRKFPVGIDDENATKRLNILNEIICINEGYCRRDVEIPDLEFEQQTSRFETLMNMRKEAGMQDSHPTICASRATLLMLKGHYPQARVLLDEAISANNNIAEEFPSEKIIAIRDNARLYGTYARCLYLEGKYDSALECADDSRRIAARITGEDDEEGEWNKFAGAPNLQYVPVAVHALFSTCDARIHHGSWNEDDRLQRAFSGLWNDSVTKYNVPRVWRTPVKIAVVSDRIWVSRAASYVEDIAKELYIELGQSMPARIVRLTRSRWGGFHLNYPQSAAAVASGLALIVVSSQPLPQPGPILDEQGLRVEVTISSVREVIYESGVEADPQQLAESINSYSSDTWTASEATQQLASNADVVTNRLVPLYMSDSEGSVSRV